MMTAIVAATFAVSLLIALVEVATLGPLGGPVTIVTSGGRHAISLELARLISVGDSQTSLRSA